MPTDPHCLHHPDRLATVYCQKYGRYYCDECVHCREPMQYCKFRTSCLVWELEKHGWPEDAPERRQPVAGPDGDEAGAGQQGDHDEKAPDEQAPDEQAPDEQAPDEQAPDEQATDEQATDEQAPDEQATDEQAPDEQATASR